MKQNPFKVFLCLKISKFSIEKHNNFQNFDTLTIEMLRVLLPYLLRIVVLTIKVKLTKRYGDALPFSDTNKYHQDLELIGFAVRVGKKTKQYMVNKRIDNKLYCIVISDVSLMTITEARDEAMRIMSDIKKGIDPNAKKSSSKANPVPTLQECYDYFKAHRTLTDETLHSYNRQIETLLKDWLKLPIDSITKTMIGERHAKLTKNSPAQANATMRVLRSVWNYCRQSFLDSNEEPYIKEHPIAILNVKKDWNYTAPKKTPR